MQIIWSGNGAYKLFESEHEAQLVIATLAMFGMTDVRSYAINAPYGWTPSVDTIHLIISQMTSYNGEVFEFEENSPSACGFVHWLTKQIVPHAPNLKAHHVVNWMNATFYETANKLR